MVALGAERELDADGWCERLRRLDGELEAEPTCGETTLVVVQVRRGELWGASVGDSGALLVEPDRVIDLTAAQSRKPLVGSGASRPAGIRRRPLSARLLVATDGLLKYASRATISALARTGDVHTAVEAGRARISVRSHGAARIEHPRVATEERLAASDQPKGSRSLYSFRSCAAEAMQ